MESVDKLAGMNNFIFTCRFSGPGYKNVRSVCVCVCVYVCLLALSWLNRWTVIDLDDILDEFDRQGQGRRPGQKT